MRNNLLKSIKLLLLPILIIGLLGYIATAKNPTSALNPTPLSDVTGDGIVNIVDARKVANIADCNACNDLTADGQINQLDEKELLNQVESVKNGGPASARFDTNNDGQVNDDDLATLANFKGKSVVKGTFGLENPEHLSFGYTARELVIGFFGPIAEAEIRKFLESEGLIVFNLIVLKGGNGTPTDIPDIAPYIVTVLTNNLKNPDDLDNIAAQIKNKHPQIKYVEKDLWGKGVQGHVNDPRSHDQWGHFDIKVDRAWVNDTMGHSSIKVAVLDTGIDVNHPEFSGKLVNKFNALCRVLPGAEDCNDLSPTSSHGTKMAGIIAASANNNWGIAGVAPNVSIMPIKVMHPTDFLISSNAFSHGVFWAVDHGAKVINMSISLFGSNSANDSLTFAWEEFGVQLIASTGNVADSTTCSFPASHPNVIGVGAYGKNSDGSRYLWPETTTGCMDMVAPGVNILTIEPDSGPQTGTFITGTSPATAYVSGVMALLKTVSARSNGWVGFVEPLDSPARISEAFTVDAEKTLWNSNCFRVDVAHNHRINVADIQSIAFRWGTQAGDSFYNPRFEITPVGGNGAIDVFDLQTLFAKKWNGEICPSLHLHP